MLFTNEATRQERLEKCKSCKYYQAATRTCGPLGIGKEVTYRKQKKQLCGCIMPIKTRLKMATCPLGKWESTISKTEILQIGQYLENRTPGRWTEQEREQVVALYNIATGGNEGVTTCTGCLENMVMDLKRTYDAAMAEGVI